MKGMTSKDHTTVFTFLVTSRLTKMLGEVKGAEVLAEVLQKLGKNTVDTPDELRRVADELISRGGLVGSDATGQSLMKPTRPLKLWISSGLSAVE